MAYYFVTLCNDGYDFALTRFDFLNITQNLVIHCILCCNHHNWHLFVNQSNVSIALSNSR